MRTRDNALRAAGALVMIVTAFGGAAKTEARPAAESTAAAGAEAKTPKKVKKKGRPAGEHSHAWSSWATYSHRGLGWRPRQGHGQPVRRHPRHVAIATARAQIGKPYRWAGVGPSSFDCSGLTQFAWAAAGVDLPHNSSAQYGAVKRIPVEDMRPGDLVFSGGGGIGHVGLYIGEGKMIHAPHSGRRVEIAPLRSNVIGAGRPA